MKRFGRRRRFDFDDDDEDWDDDYYSTYYESNQCLGGCPAEAHCEWSFCECDEGYDKSLGRCFKSSVPKMDNTRLEIDPEVNKIPCTTMVDCSKLDLNLVCSSFNQSSVVTTLAPGEVVTNQTEGTCHCRRDMKWNKKALECQILLDVDCSQFDYSSPVSEFVANATERAEKRANETLAAAKKLVEEENKQRCVKLDCVRDENGGYYDSTRLKNCWKKGCQILPKCAYGEFAWDNSIMTCDPFVFSYSYNYGWDGGNYVEQYKPPTSPKEAELNRTETPTESLTDSLLYEDFPSVEDEIIPAKELDELFCRDIDAFSEAYQMVDENRPYSCPEVPDVLCAVLYDSSSCRGGWSLNVTIGEHTRLKYWSSYWKYRNDADLVGVRYGCTFTGFSSSNFDGEKIILAAGTSSRWTKMSSSYETKYMDENIESFQCICRE